MKIGGLGPKRYRVIPHPEFEEDYPRIFQTNFGRPRAECSPRPPGPQETLSALAETSSNREGELLLHPCREDP